MTNDELIAQLIATAQPRTEQVRVCARGDLVAAHEEATRVLQAALRDDDSLAGSPDSITAAEAVRRIEEEMDAATVTFTLAAVSRRVWADLLAAHPPSKEDRRAGHDHDPRSFPVALVAACTKEPTLTEEQAKQLADVLPVGEWSKLWATAFTLNITPTPTPKLGAATELLRANAGSSTTPATGASPDPGSLAGSGEQ